MVFRLFESRLLAALLAGGYFTGFGVYVAFQILRWPDRWRSLTLYPLIVHVAVVSIPMMVVRLAHLHEPFEQVQIWGLPGPRFHALSTRVFSLLIVATVVDLIRAFRQSKG